ncbi:MAG: hypothetical protein IJA20_08290 [Methanocorpusculum sp.]|nr:hypothetical protein [Oscillospiraceae bacterium]MBQ3570651.1 hypothetical protein [Methanocorpusculum sp.]
MKKHLAIILALTMTLCLCACTSNGGDPDTADNDAAVSDSNPPDASVGDDVLVVDPDGSEDVTDAPEDDGGSHDDEPTAESSTTEEDETPKRTQFTDADKEAAKSAAVEMVKSDCQQESATIYGLKVTDLYNCVVTAGYTVMEDEKETLFLSDYDLHYDNGQWVKTAAYNRGSFDTSIYEISYDEAGSLVISPKQS